MENDMTVKGLVSRDTIVLHPSEGQPINISRQTNELLFLEVEDIINNRSMEDLITKYVDIKRKIERYSSNLFTVDEVKGEMYLKGDDVAMPELMVDKLLELEKANEDVMPLIRFWKKLRKNPSKHSIDQLYGFMVHNGIGLTELGDIVVEKGVGVKNGILVDLRTRKIDNSIGETVVMNRESVDANPEVTCSFGLHVGAPEHVRQYYSGIIVKCSVNPADVVAVPTDYNNTKMRVCKYTVLGYSDNSTQSKPVFKLSDFVTFPSEDVQTQITQSLPKPVTEDEETENLGEAGIKELEVKEEVVTPDPSAEYVTIAKDTLSEMTGKQILDFVEEETGVRMKYSWKSKSTLVKRGSELLAKHLETLDNK